jgi:hypothetical protein
MANVGELEIKVEVGGDTALWRGQEFCGIAWDLGVREWEHERASVAIDRLLSGLDGGFPLPDAVKAAIGDSMIDRAVAVLRASGREFIITNQLNPTDLQERGEVRIREMDLNVTEQGGVEVVARFTVVPLRAHEFGWRMARVVRSEPIDPLTAGMPPDDL